MISFDRFIEYFPEVEPPFTLSEENVADFSRNNVPLPAQLIAEHLHPVEADEVADEELTEYIPCLRLPNLKDFYAIVYWKGGLMNYQYILVTFTMGGKLIDRRVLSGTVSDGSNIVRSVARIDSDLSILIMSGFLEGEAANYQAASSTTIELELLPDGKMLELA